MKTTLHTLQAYRAFAAILVVLSHAYNINREYFSKNEFPLLFSFGNAGVQFFFVLSGFIIFWAHQKDIGRRDQTLKYLYKRFIRIYPIYWFITLSLLPFWLLFPNSGQPYHRQFLPLIKSLLLIPQSHGTHLSVGWTLTHEVLFYLVFAILLFSRKLGAFLIGAWVLGILVAESLNGNDAFPSNFFLNPNNLLFPLGMLAGMAVLKFPVLRGRNGALVFLAGNVVFGITAFFNGSFTHSLSQIMSYGFGAFLIVAGGSCGLLENIFQKSRALNFLGDASYSIYLIHYPVLSLLAKIFSRADFSLKASLMFPLLVILALVSGILLYVTVEKPLLERLRKFQPI